MNTAFMPRSSDSLCCKHIFCVKVQIAREHTPCALAVTFFGVQVFRCRCNMFIVFICVSCHRRLLYSRELSHQVTLARHN